MKYKVTINETEYEVEVERGQASVLGTRIVEPVEVAQKKVEPAKVESAAKPVTTNITGEVVKAPMPGTILDIKLSQGSSVKKGDVVMVLEAMKMENEITAAKDGVISQIVVSKGASVVTGDVLFALNN